MQTQEFRITLFASNAVATLFSLPYLIDLYPKTTQLKKSESQNVVITMLQQFNQNIIFKLS